MIGIRQILSLLAIALVAIAPSSPIFAQESTPDAPPSKVFVVPMKGPLYYRMAATELAKVFRGAMVQKPEAVILLISSPGGDRQVALEIAQQIAEAGLPNTIAYVSGSYGGAFGPAVLPLIGCRQVFVAPDNAIDLQAAVRSPQDSAAAPLAPREISLLQTWAAQNRLSWNPLQQWFTEGGLLPAAAPQGAAPASAPAASQPVAKSLPGTKPLRAQLAPDLKDILQQIGASNARIITWPDPVERTNETMRKVFQQADDLVKTTNAAIAAARDADPRSHRYELQDMSREQSVGVVVVPPRHHPTTQASTEYYTTDRVTVHDQFSDGGASWRGYSDRCIALVREAMSSNRRLAALVARYPEVTVDPKELGDSYATLSAWLNQLRAERPLRSPPGNP